MDLPAVAGHSGLPYRGDGGMYKVLPCQQGHWHGWHFLRFVRKL